MISALLIVFAYLLNIFSGLVIGLNLFGWKPKWLSHARWEYIVFLCRIFIAFNLLVTILS